MEFDEAKKELKSYLNIEKAITQMQLWIDDKKANSNKLTSTLSAEPKGSPIYQDTMAEKLTDIIDLEADIQVKINEMRLEQKRILNKILRLDVKYQNILFCIYVAGNTIESTASIIGKL